MALLSVLAVASLASASAYSEGNIYPSGHFTFSTGLTKASFEPWVQQQVDSGKTAFVVEDFASNGDVAFGDVLLSEESIRGEPYNPGAGGWPTIRYFNAETGYKGSPYDKKTSKSMCDELGDMEYMTAYVMEMGKTSKCSAATGAGCGEKELKYIEKWAAKGAEEVASQAARLEGMEGGKMKPDLAKWITQRIAVLKQLPLGAAKAEL